jgi:diguanylate cyclase (GGDEF)-like protein
VRKKPDNLVRAAGRVSGAWRGAAATRRTGKSSVPDLAQRLRTFEPTVRRRLASRDALRDLVRAVNATLEPARVADVLLECASTWAPAPIWAVVAADPGGPLLTLAQRGAADWSPVVQAVANLAITRGEVLAFANLAVEPRMATEAPAAALALPLACRGRRVGAVVALDPRPSARPPRPSPSWFRAVEVLLEPAALALDTALRFRRAEALSVTDDLTGLYNSRYLNQVLRRETKRASRSGRPLSLLFIDLDGFKSINDTHGHLFGSRALVEAAAIIRSSARETDMVSRFGGDEFSVVLPDTGGEGAFAVGERIRERVAAFVFLSGDGLEIRLTASVGVATLPDAAASAEELIQAADKAMYQVKDAGKNGIQAAAASADN